MTGPEHFKEAEENLKWASKSDMASGEAAYHVGVAQVHATLALVALTYRADPTFISAKWNEVTGAR